MCVCVRVCVHALTGGRKPACAFARAAVLTTGAAAYASSGVIARTAAAAPALRASCPRRVDSKTYCYAYTRAKKPDLRYLDGHAQQSQRD